MTGAPATRLRVAVVSETGAGGASARYRALQHVGRLRARHDVQVLVAAGVPSEPGAGRVRKARYFARHALAYVARTVQLRWRLRRFDVVFVQRGAYPLGPGTVVRPIERFRGRVVFDLDDAVFEVSPSLMARGRSARWLYGPQQALRVLERADAVVVSTDRLASTLPGRDGADAVLPTVPDPARYPVRRHARRVPAVIGWVGNAGNFPHLDVLVEPMAALRAEGTATLEIVSSRRWRDDAGFRRWTLSAETEDLLRFDVGVMPLLDTPYSRSKAGFKLLQYLAAGLPVVASPVGVNVDIVRDSGAGLLATTSAEWEEALRRLAGDVDLRAELGARGRAWIDAFADLDEQAAVLSGLLEGTTTGPGAP